MYDENKEREEKRRKQTELENFIEDNSRNIVHFSTQSGVFQGQIVFHQKTDRENIVDLDNCTLISNHNSPYLGKVRIYIKEIIAWGIKE